MFFSAITFGLFYSFSNPTLDDFSVARWLRTKGGSMWEGVEDGVK